MFARHWINRKCSLDIGQTGNVCQTLDRNRKCLLDIGKTRNVCQTLDRNRKCSLVIGQTGNVRQTLDKQEMFTRHWTHRKCSLDIGHTGNVPRYWLQTRSQQDPAKTQESSPDDSISRQTDISRLLGLQRSQYTTGCVTSRFR